MTDSDKPAPYAPIDCDHYSEYELAIMHRQKLRLRWSEDNVVYDQAVLPLDLRTVEHEEFLVCRDEGGQVRTIRLDRIHKMATA